MAMRRRRRAARRRRGGHDPTADAAVQSHAATIPGYIKGYLPGIRENGGQYTHGVLWVVRAMAEMGRGTRAVELLRMLSPSGTRSSTGAGRRLSNRAVRRGGRCVRRAAARRPRRLDLVHRLGRLDVSRGGGIDSWAVDRSRANAGRSIPSISSAWPQCRLTYRLPDGTTRYEITIENPTGKERGVSQRHARWRAGSSSRTAPRAFRCKFDGGSRIALSSGCSRWPRLRNASCRWTSRFRPISSGAPQPAPIRSKARRWPTAPARASGIASRTLPGKIADKRHGDVACDHYRRFADDVRLMRELGHPRLSVQHQLVARAARRHRAERIKRGSTSTAGSSTRCWSTASSRW